MTKNSWWLAFLFSLTSLGVFSQTDSTKQRNTTRYLGIQANQLIRQIFNFSNSNTPIDNPYLITYSVNSKKTGVGFNAGLGFSVNEFSDGDPSNKRETKINNLSFRLGAEKKSMIGKRWMVSWGFDIVHDNLKNETSNIQNNDPTNPAIRFVSTTTNTTSSWGLGPRFTLNFQITSRILLGTEANYYYRSGSTKGTASTSNTFFNGTGLTTNSSNTESSSDFTKFQFNLPAVIYVILKF